MQKAGYAYDANGNQTSGAGRSLTWSSFNKPSGISTANGYTGFAYDANHNRVLKTTPTTTTAYIGKIFQRTVMNGVNKDISNIYAGKKLVASIEEVAGLSPTIKYMHGDHLGSISVITDANGAVIERLRFDVFGAPVNLNGTAKTNFGASNTDRGFTGHEMDASTGLINMNARLYDPVLGRFISSDTIITDPLLMQDFNRYSYVLNNPLAYTVPSGHSWWTSFRDSFLVPFARQVVTTVVAAALIYFGVDPTAAYGIGGFTSSMIFGGNGKQNIIAGFNAAAFQRAGNREPRASTRFFLRSGLIAFNYGVKRFSAGNGSPTVSNQIISGASVVTSGNGFQTGAFQRLFKDASNGFAMAAASAKSWWDKNIPSKSMVIDAIYTGAKVVEKAAAPIGAAAAYGALTTLNPQLAFIAYGVALVGGGAIIVQQLIQPDMHQAVDQFNQLILEMMFPKPMKAFTGYLYDGAKYMAEQK